MSKRYQYGRGIYSLIADGMFLASIISRIRELNVPIRESLLTHNLYESFPLGNSTESKKLIARNLKSLESILSPQIKKINKDITTVNEVLKGLDFQHRIPRLKSSDIFKLTKKRLRTIFKVKDAQKISNEHFGASLEKILKEPTGTILNFLSILEKERYKDETRNMSDPYLYGFRQALDVCSIGYYSTAVFIAGRTVEELVNSYLEALFKFKKIEKLDLSKTRFEKKINLLHSKKRISDEIYYTLSSIKIDRNRFAHPSTKILNKQKSHLKIRSMMLIVPDIEKRIKRLNAQASGR